MMTPFTFHHNRIELIEFLSSKRLFLLYLLHVLNKVIFD